VRQDAGGDASPDHAATPAERAALLHDVARHLGVPLDALTAHAASGEAADVEAAVERLLAQGQNGETTRTDVDAVALRRRLVTLWRHVEAVRQHRPGPIAGRLHVFDAEIQVAGVTRRVPPWERLAAGGVVREMVPGSHHELLRAPHVDTLAARLRMVLVETARGRA
jgi:thioesterase domain-containing protein